MKKRVVIDCFPESAAAYGRGHVVVAVDVIRATTSAMTIAARGGRCFPAPSIGAARELASKLENPILAGEVGGEMPPGFEMNNSPADFDTCINLARPVILLSSSGTGLLHEARRADAVHLACFRNYRYLGRYLAGRYSQIALIGAGSRNEFREEDQMCCAWIARQLVEAGYAPANSGTSEIIRRWKIEDPAAIISGKSAAYLRRSGQLKDLDFVLTHVNDLSAAFLMRNRQVVVISNQEVRPVNPADELVSAGRTVLNTC